MKPHEIKEKLKNKKLNDNYFDFLRGTRYFLNRNEILVDLNEVERKIEYLIKEAKDLSFKGYLCGICYPLEEEEDMKEYKKDTIKWHLDQL